MAAIRELKEEIGLEISRDRLEHCSLCCFGGEDCSRCTQNDRLFFNIYSLELNRTADSDEIQEVKASRPHSNLWPFDMTTLQDYHREGKFNRLLQGQFESVFCHIFHDIGISQR
jgi:8-oxo-dGTP pyrophosphatase MutT (NUDIX family)